MKAITYWKEIDDKEHAIVVRYRVCPKEPDVGLFNPYIDFDEFLWAENPDKMPSSPDAYLSKRDFWLIEAECWDHAKERNCL